MGAERTLTWLFPLIGCSVSTALPPAGHMRLQRWPALKKSVLGCKKFHISFEKIRIDYAIITLLGKTLQKYSPKVMSTNVK